MVRGFGNAQTHLCVAGALGPGVPHIINSKLLKHFTCLTYNNGRSVLDFRGLTSGASACRGESRREGLGRGSRAWIGFHATDTAGGSTHGHLQGPGVKVVEETLHITCFVPLGEVPVSSSRKSCHGDFFRGILPHTPQNRCSMGRQWSRKAQASVMSLGKGPRAAYLALFPAFGSECVSCSECAWKHQQMGLG